MTASILLAAALLGPPKLPPLPGERPPPPLPVELQPAAEPEPTPAPDPVPEDEPEDSARSGPPSPASPVSRASEVDPEPPLEAPNATSAQEVVLANGPRGLEEPALGRRAAPPPKRLERASADELARLTLVGATTPRAGSETDQDPGQRPVKPGDRPTPPRGRTQTVRRDAYVDDGVGLQARSPGDPPKRTSAFAFGYRLFLIKDAFERPQSWHVGSVEVTPVRRYVRLNLVTEFGWEGGPAARNGDRADFLLMQKAGLGLQYPHWVTPFVEFQGGAGAMRVELFDRSDLLLLYTFGIDAGAQWAVARWMRLHAAVGWIRPIVRRPEYSVRYDSFTFKCGFGF